jgi:Spy/CpxP family protein refolding chaperone
VRLSRDTKDDENTIERPANEREKGFLFAERLERSGHGIQGLMETWQVAREPRISEVADQLHAAGRDLVEMAASLRELAQGGDPDEHSAAFKARKEDLTGRWFSAATLVAHRDSTMRLVLTPEQKRAIVALIETELFEREMAEFDQTPDNLKESFITQPDLYAVIAFRNVYKRELKAQ